MKELSLNVLDIVLNSVKAKASLVTIEILERERLEITITDNGCGMAPEFLARVIDPFTTTRTTRKVGLGIPLFKLAAEMAGGTFQIESEVGVGTTVRATFDPHNIDCPPLGDMAGTMVTLISGYPETDFLYRRAVGEHEFSVDTRQLREIMGEIPLSSFEVTNFVREMIEENERELTRGGNE